MDEQKDQVTRDNYLAIVLLLCLACRKIEVLAAQWYEFNLEEYFWIIPAERTKTGTIIKSALCRRCLCFLSRRRSKRDYVSLVTLNAAIYKLFFEKELVAYSGDDEHPFWSEREHLNVPALG